MNALLILSEVDGRHRNDRQNWPYKPIFSGQNFADFSCHFCCSIGPAGFIMNKHTVHVVVAPDSLPPSVPQILINREPLRHLTFDVELLGDCDVIIKELCLRLGDDWSASCTSHEPAREVRRDEMSTHTPTPSPPDSASTPDTPNTEQHVDGSNVVGASTEYSGETQTADSTQADAACVDGKVQADSATSTVDTDDTVCSADANVSKDGSSCPSETGAVATAAESPSHPPSLAAGLQGTYCYTVPRYIRLRCRICCLFKNLMLEQT